VDLSAASFLFEELISTKLDKETNIHEQFFLLDNMIQQLQVGSLASMWKVNINQSINQSTFVKRHNLVAGESEAREKES